MKRKVSLIIACCFIFVTLLSQNKWVSEGWLLFLKVKFQPKFLKEYNDTFLQPVFTPAIKARVGTDVSLSGYYMPFELDSNRIILSKYPYSACFFCGGAGPESVVEVELEESKPALKVDQVITVKGKLKLNDSNIDRLNFLLEQTEIIKN